MTNQQTKVIELKRDNGQTTDYWVSYRMGRTLYHVSVQEQADGQTDEGEVVKERFPFYFGMKTRMLELAEAKEALGFRPLTEAEKAAPVIEEEEAQLDPAFFKPAIRYAWLMLGLGILLFLLPSPILNGLAFGLGLYIWYETFGQPGIPRNYQRYFHGMLAGLTILQVLSAERFTQPYYATICVLSAIVLVLLVVQHRLKETDQIGQEESIRVRKMKDYSDLDL
ncbi:hypothetical protein [Exiguobacterium sp. MH3]|uniref:hypothetical protein n=1 Tax=Exiguobacterium sp. MH3 TaxID=1399115 RepID=UPI0003C3CB67|nr:hypothetical protein [Exiguobacterium sp. MH3]AHA29595.1 hypothetical protein U719_07280 [Exiguobacterium sp. MH3]